MDLQLLAPATFPALIQASLEKAPIRQVELRTSLPLKETPKIALSGCSTVLQTGMLTVKSDVRKGKEQGLLSVLNCT